MAKLYFRYGAMNSGKSTQLLQVAYNYEERHQKVIVCKPSIDTREGSDVIRGRVGLERKLRGRAVPHRGWSAPADRRRSPAGRPSLPRASRPRRG